MMTIAQQVRASSGGLWTVVAGREPPPARPRPWLSGLFLLLGLATAALVHEHVDGLPPAVRLGLAAGAGVPVALLPRHVLAAWRIAMVATLLNLPAEIAPDGLSWPWHPVQVVILPGLVLLIALRHRTSAVVWVVLLTAATMVGHLTSPGVAAAVVVLGVVGDLIRRRAEVQHSLVAVQERSAVLEERSRIAREMHDVVAHHMSMIAVRAETAPYRIGAGRDARDAEFVAIAGASRAALQDMRRLLGVLRGEADPEPGLADIAAMVRAAAESGLDVTLTGTGGVAAGRTAYRIVQEGLSNATRHAAGAAVRVEVTTRGRRVEISVRNEASARSDHTRGGGHGITGMRERVAAVGGELVAGPVPGGGFEVRAVLPLNA